MKTETRKGSRGFTLLEVLIAIIITTIIAILGINTFASTLSYQSVDKDTDVALSYLQKARTLTINSSNNSSYGVKFATTSITIFPGTTYGTSSQNIVYNLNARVNISLISLSNGGTSFYFNRISGDPSATGTVTFSLVSGATGSTSKQVTIYGSGLAEVK